MTRIGTIRRAVRLLAAAAVAVATVPDALAASARAVQPASSTALLRLPFPRDDGSLTPYTFEVGYPLMSLVYDTLLWRDENGIPQPWLAQSVEQSPDSRRVTLRLVAGARWHDGTSVTSSDVAFTFDFVATHPHPRFSPQITDVERVETPDSSTAVIVLRRPSPGFLDQPLADVPILPAHLWRGLPRSRLAPDGLPVGSGPYRLVGYTPDSGYRFEANAEHFGGVPTVKTIEVPIIPSAQEMFIALDQRRIDMIPVSLPRDAVPRIEVGTRIERGVSYLGTVLVLNVRRPPFDRLEVRQAVARAIDPDRIADAVGDAVAADRGYLHPDSPWALRRTSLPPARPVPAIPELSAFSLKVLTPNNDPVKLETARQVSLALERVGVAVEVTELPRDELSRALGEDGSTPTFAMAVSASPPLASYDPNFLRTVFGSDPDLSKLNYAGYASTRFDTLAQRIASTPDPDARRSAVEEVLNLLAEDVPVIPLFFSTGSFIFRPSVYDQWVFVKGTGILDKRSFMPVPLTPTESPAAPADDPGVVSSSSDGSPFGKAAVALVVLAGILAAFALVPRRR